MKKNARRVVEPESRPFGQIGLDLDRADRTEVESVVGLQRIQRHRELPPGLRRHDLDRIRAYRNAEYDAFLFGSVTRPPVQSRRHVEEMFRRLTQSPSESAADRYDLYAQALTGEEAALIWQNDEPGYLRAVSLARFDSTSKISPTRTPCLRTFAAGSRRI